MQGAIEHLRSVVSQLGESSDSGRILESVQEPLSALRQRGEELGFAEIDRAAAGLQRYLDLQVHTEPTPDAITVFQFALGSLVDAMDSDDFESRAGAFRSADILEILDLPEEANRQTSDAETTAKAPSDSEAPAALPAEAPQRASEALDFSRLRRVVEELGGTLEPPPGAGCETSFRLSFPATQANLNQLETLFFPLDADLGMAPKLPDQDERLAEMLLKIKDFMQAMANGNLEKGQAILAEIAEQKHQAGLYREIGTMARGLHNSLKEFVQNLDPTLKDMVEDKIPDSGSRLEHILKLTEKAANTTLDNVETMQRDNQEDQKRLVELQQLFQQLRAVGEPAQKCLQQGSQLIQTLRDSILQAHDRLITVLTAQDYQDLTGQVILKIMNLLSELETKLIGVISTFGVKVETKAGSAPKEELYGPAHEGMANALNSQDDVDSLLAEFGF